MFDNAFLERLADFDTVETKGTDAPHGVAESRWLDLKCHEPPVEPFEREGLLDHVLRRIAGDGAGDEAALFDERGAGHGS